MKQASLVGLMEAYHEHLGMYADVFFDPRSYCLFHGKLLGHLPEHCNCESVLWSSYVATQDAHGERYNATVAGLAPRDAPPFGGAGGLGPKALRRRGGTAPGGRQGGAETLRGHGAVPGRAAAPALAALRKRLRARGRPFKGLSKSAGEGRSEPV